MSQTAQQFFNRPDVVAAAVNLSSSAIEPLTLRSLLELVDVPPETLLDTRLSYGMNHGSNALRERIARLYPGLGPGDIVVTAGADEALAMLNYALLEPGDGVVVQTPCYFPHTTLPTRRGASVYRWKGDPGGGWTPDLEELPGLLAPSAKWLMIAVPQNPTGIFPDTTYFERMVETTAAAGALLVVDEVYGGLGPRSAAADFAARRSSVVLIDALSKSLALPGLRVGWIATRNEKLLAKVRALRDLFNAHTPAVIDELACLALDHREELLERSRRITSDGLDAARVFFQRFGNAFAWTAPHAGALSLVEWRGPGDARELSEALLVNASVAFAPGECFQAPNRFLRLAVGKRDVRGGLERVGAFIEQHHPDLAGRA